MRSFGGLWLGASNCLVVVPGVLGMEQAPREGNVLALNFVCLSALAEAT